MLMAYASVGAFFLVAIGFVLGAMLFGWLVRPDNPSEGKVSTYECGEVPYGLAWFNFNPRFYVIALVYIIFDVEIAFIYPVSTVLKRWVEAGQGTVAIVEVLTFVGILIVGLAYVWVERDLDWIRNVKSQVGEHGLPVSPTAPAPAPEVDKAA